MQVANICDNGQFYYINFKYKIEECGSDIKLNHIYKINTIKLKY